MLVSIKEKLSGLVNQGFFHILLGGTLTKIVAFFSSILIVRFVTKTDYAFLSYADNIYSYIYLITGFGLDSAVLKYCVTDDKKKNNSYLFFAFKYGTIAEMVVMFFSLIAFCTFHIPFSGAKLYLFSLLLYPFLYYWCCLLQSYMRARLMNKEYAKAGIIQTVLVFLISLGFVFAIGAYSVVVARYISAILIMVYMLYVIQPEIKVKRIKLKKQEKMTFIKFGVSILIANVFSMIMPINENFLVNNLIKDTVVSANYKVANLFPQQLTFLTSAIITFYFPYFAKMKKSREIKKKAFKVGLLTFFSILIVTVIGIFISPAIIHIAYGDKYSDINTLMSALWIMHGVNAGLRMLPMNILPAIGYTKFNAVMSVVACGFHFIIDYICIKKYGVNGAVIAGSLVYLSTAICYWFYLNKKLGERKEVRDEYI